MWTLKNPIQAYAWGSRVAIAQLQGRPGPSAAPEAELWMGAHPSAPSLVVDGSDPRGRALIAVLADDFVGALGQHSVRCHGERLPYLLKILAAEHPLSVQVHPDAEQARAGFDAEGAANVPLDVPGRNYVDPYHKPELMVALDSFQALYGFREPDRSAEEFAALGLAELDPVIAALRADRPYEQSLREAVELLLNWPTADRHDLVTAVREGCLAAGGGLAATLAVEYPGDIGVLVALLLNRVRLEPGQALFVPAGCPHAYLRGVGVEIMASSDNVLRCGLTSKHVDAAETARLLRYDVLTELVRDPVPLAPGLVTWPVPVPDFRLVRADLDASAGPVILPGSGARIAVCVRGIATLRAGQSELTLRQGESAFVSAAEPPVAVAAHDAVVFEASPGSSGE